jgi:hypothetical protein
VAFAIRLLIDDFAFPNVSYVSYLTPASSYVAYTSFVSAFPFNTKYPTRFMKSVRDVEKLQEENIADTGINTVICLSFEEGNRVGGTLLGLDWRRFNRN